MTVKRFGGGVRVVVGRGRPDGEADGEGVKVTRVTGVVGVGVMVEVGVVVGVVGVP